MRYSEARLKLMTSELILKKFMKALTDADSGESISKIIAAFIEGRDSTKKSEEVCDCFLCTGDEVDPLVRINTYYDRDISDIELIPTPVSSKNLHDRDFSDFGDVSFGSRKRVKIGDI